MTNWYVSSESYRNVPIWGGGEQLALQANVFSNASWTKTNLSDNSFVTSISDANVGTMVLLNEGTAAAYRGISQQITRTATILPQVYTFSIHAKPGPNRSRLALGICTTPMALGTLYGVATYDLANGLCAIANMQQTWLVQGVEIVPTGNGVYRISISVQVPAATTTFYVEAMIDSAVGNAGSNFTYAGTAGNGIYIAKAMLDRNSVMGPFINSTTAAVNPTSGQAVSVGQLIRPLSRHATHSCGAERVYRCTTAGTTGPTEPFWNLGKGGTTQDNTVMWTEVTGIETYQGSGSTWAAPFARFTGTSNANGVVTASGAAPTITAGGTNYNVNDLVALTAGSIVGAPFIARVQSVSLNAVTALTIVSTGLYTSSYPPTSGAATVALNGTGTGLTVGGLIAGAYTTLNPGDTVYLSNTHNEYMTGQNVPPTVGAASLTPVPVNLISSTESGSTPPARANWTFGATLRVGAPIAGTTFIGPLYANSVSFVGGHASLTKAMIFSQGGTFDDCNFEWQVTLGSALFLFQHATRFRGCTLTRTVSGQYMQNWYTAKFYGCTAIGAFAASSYMFQPGSNGCEYTFDGCDFSAAVSGTIYYNGSGNPGNGVFKNCDFPASLSIPQTVTNIGIGRTDILGSDSGSMYQRNERYDFAGTLLTETSVVRTGGATDGGTAISHRIATSASASNKDRFEAFPLAFIPASTGSVINVTVEGIWVGTALPGQDEFFIDASVQDTSLSTLGDIVSGSVSASTQAWDGTVSARQSSHAYTLGQSFTISGKTGMVFFCTTAGTTASSQPGGYTSAVDGGAVTDGTAVFTAGVRFKYSFSVVPAYPEPIVCYPYFARPSSTYYLDPTVTLS